MGTRAPSIRMVLIKCRIAVVKVMACITLTTRGSRRMPAEFLHHQLHCTPLIRLINLIRHINSNTIPHSNPIRVAYRQADKQKSAFKALFLSAEPTKTSAKCQNKMLRQIKSRGPHFEPRLIFRCNVSLPYFTKTLLTRLPWRRIYNPDAGFSTRRPCKS